MPLEHDRPEVFIGSVEIHTEPFSIVDTSFESRIAGDENVLFEKTFGEDLT